MMIGIQNSLIGIFDDRKKARKWRDYFRSNYENRDQFEFMQDTFIAKTYWKKRFSIEMREINKLKVDIKIPNLDLLEMKYYEANK